MNLKDINAECQKLDISTLHKLIKKLETILFVKMEKQNKESVKKFAENIQKNIISAINEITK